jgi:hypothetical protein
MVPAISEEHQRLVDWNTAILSRLLVATPRTMLRELEQAKLQREKCLGRGLSEVEESIKLHMSDAQSANNKKDPEEIDLGAKVRDQLPGYVGTICAMQRNNLFRNFEHASHVTMSTVKLLSRAGRRHRRWVIPKGMVLRTYWLVEFE